MIKSGNPELHNDKHFNQATFQSADIFIIEQKYAVETIYFGKIGFVNIMASILCDNV
jgi:hypothetical protein